MILSEMRLATSVHVGLYQKNVKGELTRTSKDGVKIRDNFPLCDIVTDISNPLVK